MNMLYNGYPQLQIDSDIDDLARKLRIRVSDRKKPEFDTLYSQCKFYFRARWALIVSTSVLSLGGVIPVLLGMSSRLLSKNESAQSLSNGYLPLTLKEIADGGDMIAQRNYATKLLNGVGVDQNFVEAKRYYKLAADQGNPAAQNSCGIVLLREGRLVEARSFCKLSASKGNKDGQYNYARMLEKGLGGDN